MGYLLEPNNYIANLRLVEAVKYGKRFPIKLLIYKNSNLDLNQIDDYGETALIINALSGHTKIAQLLLDLGEDIAKVDRSGRTAMDLVIDEF